MGGALDETRGLLAAAGSGAGFVKIFFKRGCAMNNDANSLAEPDVDVLTFDVSDDVLERAAVVTDGQGITIGHCTHWWHCSWPM